MFKSIGPIHQTGAQRADALRKLGVPSTSMSPSHLPAPSTYLPPMTRPVIIITHPDSLPAVGVDSSRSASRRDPHTPSRLATATDPHRWAVPVDRSLHHTTASPLGPATTAAAAAAVTAYSPTTATTAANAVGVSSEGEVGNLVAYLRSQLQLSASAGGAGAGAGAEARFSPKTLRSVSAVSRHTFARVSALQRSRRTPLGGRVDEEMATPVLPPVPTVARAAASSAAAANLNADGKENASLSAVQLMDLAAPLDALTKAREQQGLGTSMHAWKVRSKLISELERIFWLR